MSEKNTVIRRIVDIAMTILLLCLMAYQVTGEMLHEWIGMAMTFLVIFHQYLNRRWYVSLFKGRYNSYRTITTLTNALLMLSFLLTAFCGMSMSSYAVPFLYGMAPVAFVRRMHLSMSHWSFVLMGLHLGMHIPVIVSYLKPKDKTRKILFVLYCCAACIGLWLFIRSDIHKYLFFMTPFAFLDYDKAVVLIFLENLLILLFWASLGTMTAKFFTRRKTINK